MSEMKRAASALVASRTERFESVHSLEDSRKRLAAALARAKLAPGDRFVAQWHDEGGRAVLEARFLPPRGIHALLRAISLLMAVLVAASAYVILSMPTGALRFLLPAFTLLCILGLPLLTLALNSQREALESRIRRAIRVALLDADEAYPRRQRWPDED
jgi:hypothetical protein